ncbi:MAG TPA: hypothetical protein VHC49_01290 [Mycobacteriales bacterium]|nr:hypothetical protein [Mycobacteriales bacterium]
MRIDVLTVNHGTSRYAELLVASFLRHHPDRSGVRFVVLDNCSPEIERLDRFRVDGIEVQQTGYGERHILTTHGEILRDAVLARPDCDAYLFVDSDVCFQADGTLWGMAEELTADSGLFAIQARWMGADGTEFFESVPSPLPHSYIREYIRSSPDAPLPDPLEYAVELRMTDRVHPFCVLVRNSPEFRKTVDYIGLSPGRVEAERGGRWWDTLGLMTQVMRTHGKTWRRSAYGVLHFGSVSWDAQWAEEKAALRDSLLRRYTEE